MDEKVQQKTTAASVQGEPPDMVGKGENVR